MRVRIFGRLGRVAGLVGAIAGTATRLASGLLGIIAQAWAIRTGVPLMGVPMMQSEMLMMANAGMMGGIRMEKLEVRQLLLKKEKIN